MTIGQAEQINITCNKWLPLCIYTFSFSIISFTDSNFCFWAIGGKAQAGLEFRQYEVQIEYTGMGTYFLGTFKGS